MEIGDTAAANDGPTFVALVEAHRPAALRIAYAIADGEAEDVTQEATAKALRRFDSFQASRPFRPWFLAIVANEARNRRRSFGRRSRLILRVAAEPRADGEDLADSMARTERRQHLLDAVARLGEADREVIGMRYFAEMSEAEMADALAVAPGTVKSRLSRALTRLRAELGEEQP